jgi:CYTH domain-containing protein
MWPITAGRRVYKRRYAVRDGGCPSVIDEFTDRELCVAEIGLPAGDTEIAPPHG